MVIVIWCLILVTWKVQNDSWIDLVGVQLTVEDVFVVGSAVVAIGRRIDEVEAEFLQAVKHLTKVAFRLRCTSSFSYQPFLVFPVDLTKKTVNLRIQVGRILQVDG